VLWGGLWWEGRGGEMKRVKEGEYGFSTFYTCTTHFKKRNRGRGRIVEGMNQTGVHFFEVKT
jgi:hypothetical protein